MAVLEAQRQGIVTSPGLEKPGPYTSEEFAAFAASYPDLRAELTREGELVIMPPAGGEMGTRNADLTADLVIWNRAEKTGKVFDSSTGFVLPNGAKRSPDAAWITAATWQALSSEERQQFLPLCPDFVVELRSKTDRLSTIQEKMHEYRDNGTRLGWLLDPQSKRVEIYRPNHEVQIVDSPMTLSGEDVLPGFTLSLEGILF